MASVGAQGIIYFTEIYNLEVSALMAALELDEYASLDSYFAATSSAL